MRGQLPGKRAEGRREPACSTPQLSLTSNLPIPSSRNCPVLPSSALGLPTASSWGLPAGALSPPSRLQAREARRLMWPEQPPISGGDGVKKGSPPGPPPGGVTEAPPVSWVLKQRHLLRGAPRTGPPPSLPAPRQAAVTSLSQGPVPWEPSRRHGPSHVHPRSRGGCSPPSHLHQASLLSTVPGP